MPKLHPFGYELNSRFTGEGECPDCGKVCQRLHLHNCERWYVRRENVRPICRSRAISRSFRAAHGGKGGGRSKPRRGGRGSDEEESEDDRFIERFDPGDLSSDDEKAERRARRAATKASRAKASREAYLDARSEAHEARLKATLREDEAEELRRECEALEAEEEAAELARNLEALEASGELEREDAGGRNDGLGSSRAETEASRLRAEVVGLRAEVAALRRALAAAHAEIGRLRSKRPGAADEEEMEPIDLGSPSPRAAKRARADVWG